ncbi:MAG: hypothetical protein HC794_04660 [Nitrospiraceae bacterium]|nr:hypothetical protein [Nitrospiraceae bacterium]
MFYGVAYYPEHWPEERWPADAANMRQAGMAGVRIGEFAWSQESTSRLTSGLYSLRRPATPRTTSSKRLTSPRSTNSSSSLPPMLPSRLPLPPWSNTRL